MAVVCRFKFGEDVDREIAEAQIALAIIVAECFFGKPRVRISAGYYLCKKTGQVVIDMSTEVGEYVATLFAGLLTRQIGEMGFRVDRITEEIAESARERRAAAA